jgi:hypothetical protein
MPHSPEPPTQEPPGFETWNTETTATQTPTGSWEAEPLPDRAVPVNDDMIASLVGRNGDRESESQPVPAPSPPAWTPAPQAPMGATGSASFDQLLRLARELEYGLVELAASPGAAPAEGVSTGSLSGVLGSLQSDDDLASLRTAVETAQQRPRDVDVMLDLVLRADAIASVLEERDRLKQAVEGALAGAGDAPEAGQDAVHAGERPVEGEPADIPSDFAGRDETDEDQIAI